MIQSQYKSKSWKKITTIFSSYFIFIGLASTPVFAQSTSGKKTETIDGKVFIIHTIAAKDTYYQLSRQYGVPVKAIMSANNQKNLRLGDVVRIPTTEAKVTEIIVKKDTIKKEPSNDTPQNHDFGPTKVLTQYKVGANETLYSISKRFATDVESIKAFNKLSTDIVHEGQTLKIPDGKIQIAESPNNLPPAIVIPVPEVEKEAEEIEFETNRYGIREKKEKGIGIWMDNLESKGTSNLALHRTAPVGTILKITNPLTKNITFAKVVGKFSNTAETQDAIVILSKSAANHIGAFDKRFLIEITYGAPINN